MRLIDTHTHLYAKQFDHDREQMLQRAREQGVELFLLPNVDSSSIGPMLELEAAHPGDCLAMMGLHPTSVGENYEEELAVVRRYLDERPWVAVGEIGIDLYWDKTFVQEQQDAFLRQTEWARELDRPVVIHSRDSIDMILELLEGVERERLRGVFHCFTGTIEQARRITALGFYLGIGGVATFKNGGLDKVLPEVPTDRIILETDAPYLAPVPYRGKRNESAYVRLVAERVGEIINRPSAEIARLTSANAEALFEPDRFRKG